MGAVGDQGAVFWTSRHTITFGRSERLLYRDSGAATDRVAVGVRWLASALGNFAPHGVDDTPLPASAMADQIGSLLALAGGKPRTVNTSHRAAMLRRLQSTMTDQFHDAALTPASVARDHGVSVRYLHMLFAEAGTSFGAELMVVRLDRASTMLKDRRFNGLAMSEIAWRCGFKNPSHFARLFRRRFGSAPLNYQKGVALTGDVFFILSRAPFRQYF